VNIMSKINEWSRWLVLCALLSAVPARAQEGGTPPLSLDEEFVLLAEEVPGFGGLYLDGEGTVYVYLQDLGRAQEVESWGEHVVAIQGEYDFRDLFAWKDELRALLPWDEVLSLDIDEQRNRLRVGVEAEVVEAFQAELAGILRETSIPPEAVTVEADEATVTLEMLTDSMQPIPAGVQITGNGFCTLGTNAVSNGVEGFVTNSHCTAVRGVVDGSIFFQSTVAPGANVGVETIDPPFLVGGKCPPDRRCRFSDTAFVTYDDPSFSEGGRIANPWCAHPPRPRSWSTPCSPGCRSPASTSAASWPARW
jgi:hypothetical protein